MKSEQDLSKFLDNVLSKEDAQEQRVAAHEDSFFAGAPDDETIIARTREFDDIRKHWVRRELWLKTVKRIAKAKKAGIRLLTLPGQHLFEIKLYMKEGLLDKNGEKLSVVGFETDPALFGLLATAEPRLLEMLRGDVLTALVKPQSQNGQIIRKHAPYDVINLDLTANIATRSDGPYSPFLRGVRECFQLQGPQISQWALMVTFRAGMLDVEPKVIDELMKLFQENLDQHLPVKEACYDRYGVDTAREFVEQLPEEGLGQITAKWVIEQGHNFEWECVSFRHAAYDRSFSKANEQQRYSLRKLVFEFTRRPAGRRKLVLRNVPPQAWHAEDLVKLFQQSALLNVDDLVAKMDESHRIRLEAEIAELR